MRWALVPVDDNTVDDIENTDAIFYGDKLPSVSASIENWREALQRAAALLAVAKAADRWHRAPLFNADLSVSHASVDAASCLEKALDALRAVWPEWDKE